MPNSSNRALVPRQVALTRAATVVPYLTSEEVQLLEDTVSQNRKGERDALLIRTLFQTGLRISEALSVTPSHLDTFEGMPVIGIIGKGRKPRRVHCPTRLAESLHAYAWRNKLEPTDRFFPINRKRAYAIIRTAADDAGIAKRVYPHLLRHSDAIERLRQTGNPKALQNHLGHKSMLMTMRYLATLQEEDALRIQEQVEFE